MREARADKLFELQFGLSAFWQFYRTIVSWVHHQFGREIAVNNEIDIHLQLCFYALLIG